MEGYKEVFKTSTHNKLAIGTQYIKGLFQGQKRNMERMSERVVESEYHRIQHFISESPWDARLGFDKVAKDTSKVFESYERVALLIDESAHRKKGQLSVGVARQWCGTIGKVDNCQVAVYAALSAEKYYGLIDTALYLPQRAGQKTKSDAKKPKFPKRWYDLQDQVGVGFRDGKAPNFNRNKVSLYRSRWIVWQQLLVWAGIRQPAAIICA